MRFLYLSIGVINLVGSSLAVISDNISLLTYINLFLAGWLLNAGILYRD